MPGVGVQTAAATRQDSRVALHKALLDLHGEILLVLHWSMLAYTALCKILKKYHKRTGRLLHAPDMQDVMQYPFCSTEVCPVRAATEQVLCCCHAARVRSQRHLVLMVFRQAC